MSSTKWNKIWFLSESSPHFRFILCECLAILYTRHLLHVCPSWKRDPSSVALPEVSSIVLFFVFCFLFFFNLVKRVWVFFSINMWNFFLTQIEGLRTEDVVHCTDCKAHWGNVIVILGYINKTDLIGLTTITTRGHIYTLSLFRLPTPNLFVPSSFSFKQIVCRSVMEIMAWK